MSLQTYDHYLFAAAALIGTFAAAAAMLWLLRREPWHSRLESYAGVVPPFINVLGVLFGLTLAFLANDTWNAHDRAMAAIDREGDALRSIAVLSTHLPPAEGDALRHAARAYAQAALAEWPLLTRRESSPAADRAADALLETVTSPAIVRANSPAASQAETTLALTIRDARETRLALSQTHVNPLKWLGMAFLGFLTMVSVALVHAGHWRAMAASVMIFALASAPTAVIVLIHGNPFQPPAAVTAAPLEDVLATSLAGPPIR